ncbi:MAG TPA: hypothetical protein VFV65_00090 [Gemmatimonadales bacterium]|nr:hypothetical protein [Gemmatimonadales bacterium]
MTVRPACTGFLLLLSGALACSGGGTAATTPEPAHGAAPSKVPPVRVERPAAPSFEAAATGNGWVDGTAAAETSTRYFREVSGVRGQPFELSGDARGDEKSKACGTDWRASTARSVVLVTPDAGRGTIGFTLNATATVRRGFWRTKATLSCTTLNYTDAQAATMARGQAWIQLGGGAADPDQLVVETGGATSGEWALSVTDTLGNKFAPTQMGSTLVAALPGAGRYSVAASVTARAATAGGRDSVEQRLRATVRATSLRNAVASAIGRPPLRDLAAPFEVTVPATELADRMQGLLAKYQPCGTRPGCAGKVSDVAVSAVSVAAEGGGVAVTVTLVGQKRPPLPVVLIGEVAVRGDSLRASGLRLAAEQPEVRKKRDLSDAVARVADVASAATVALEARRAPLEAQLRSRYPVRVADLCLEASTAPAKFLGSVPSADGAELQLVFAVATEPLQACGRPR